jgi:MutS domain V
LLTDLFLLFTQTTYLKQIAMIVILAQCGSYVPAESASIPIRDRICCRIGTADDTEHNLSTFMLEMKETAFICNNANDSSLILIDELGRATSNEEGIAIAWSVSEYLLTRRAMTFFVSHYPLLAKLADMYPIVQNVCLEATISHNESNESSDISYTHKVKAGACSASKDYGVVMAAFCGWSEVVIENAQIIEKQVDSLLPSSVLYKPEQNCTNDLVAEMHRMLRAFTLPEENRSLATIRLDLTAMRTRVEDVFDRDVDDATKRRLGIKGDCDSLVSGINGIESKYTDTGNSLSRGHHLEPESILNWGGHDLHHTEHESSLECDENSTLLPSSRFSSSDSFSESSTSYSE